MELMPSAIGLACLRLSNSTVSSAMNSSVRSRSRRRRALRDRLVAHGASRVQRPGKAVDHAVEAAQAVEVALHQRAGARLTISTPPSA